MAGGSSTSSEDDISASVDLFFTAFDDWRMASLVDFEALNVDLDESGVDFKAVEVDFDSVEVDFEVLEVLGNGEESGAEVFRTFDQNSDENLPSRLDKLDVGRISFVDIFDFGR